MPNTHRHLLTPYGRKVTLFFTRLLSRVLSPGLAALDLSVPLPSPLAEALSQVEPEINRLIDEACLTANAEKS